MENQDLQIEHGKYTRIVNVVLDELVKASLLGAELAICLFVIRKTWGYNKKEDRISLTQFQKGTRKSKPTIIKALKRLHLANIILVELGDSKKGISHKYKFNKYHTQWGTLVKASLPGKGKGGKPSKENIKNLVKASLPTKDNTKDNTKGKKVQSTFLQGSQWNNLIDSFQEVNPMYLDFYKNKTERAALDALAKRITYDKLLATIQYLPMVINQPYAPKITSPRELRRDLGKLLTFYKQSKVPKNGRSVPNYIL